MTALAAIRRVLFRQRDEQAIAESLFDDQSAGVALLDPIGRLIRVNAAFTHLVSAAPGDIVWLRLPDAAQDEMMRALLQGRAARLQAERRDGSYRRCLVLTLIPVRGVGALLRLADRTHEQELEEQLGTAQRLQAVGQLTGGIAHDFNNLLTAILGGADDLLGRTDQPADRDDLEQIRAGALRGAALVRQLLAFGRQQTLQPRIIPLNEAIRSVYRLLDRLVSSAVRLKLELEEPGRRVFIDPMQLDQVLINLAINAGHAMSQGGTLTIATSHLLLLKMESLGGELIPPGRYATIEVRDTGCGIAPETLPRIFEPFFTTRQDSGGNGLGLSTVHGIVRQSGGFLSVESEVGRGTTFLILLPRHEQQPWQEATSAAAPLAVHAGDGRTVLLVEDEAPVRRLAERALRNQGWEVLIAGSGEEALEIATPETGAAPDLCCLVSDVVMPGMDGPSLVQQLRRTKPHLPAILVSGYADAALRGRLAEDSIRFMAKPFAMKDLVAAVDSLCPAPRRLERLGAAE